MEISIEKGVPMPTVKTRSSYPLKQMQIGDSFVIPNDSKVNGLRQCAKYAGVKIAQRREGHNVRIWRIA